jgi:tripartite-type tricarboxylate transporter receptor subunit TctC
MLPPGKKHLEAGTIKALAIANDNRDPQLPNTPTLKERGINMSFALERGVVAPKGTPKEIIDMWAGIIKQAVDNPSLQKGHGGERHRTTLSGALRNLPPIPKIYTTLMRL